jgi:hypothetical protein
MVGERWSKRRSIGAIEQCEGSRIFDRNLPPVYANRLTNLACTLGLPALSKAYARSA